MSKICPNCQKVFDDESFFFYPSGTKLVNQAENPQPEHFFAEEKPKPEIEVVEMHDEGPGKHVKLNIYYKLKGKPERNVCAKYALEAPDGFCFREESRFKLEPGQLRLLDKNGEIQERIRPLPVDQNGWYGWLWDIYIFRLKLPKNGTYSYEGNLSFYDLNSNALLGSQDFSITFYYSKKILVGELVEDVKITMK